MHIVGLPVLTPTIEVGFTEFEADRVEFWQSGGDEHNAEYVMM